MGRFNLWLLALLFCCSSLTAFGQVFKGRVVQESGVPIPYATLYFSDLKTGVTTDDEGFFQTIIESGEHTLEVSSIGYVKKRLSIRMKPEGVEMVIQLAEQVYELKEVTIGRNTEDPAYRVMRQAIARAPFHRSQLLSFQCGTYLKGTGKLISIPAILKLSKEVRKETKKVMGKLFVMEEHRAVSYVAPNKWTNRVKAYTNSFPDDWHINIGIVNVNLYTPMLFDKISPLAVNAFSYYKFVLEGCYAEGDRLINKIRVIPRSKNPKLIGGVIYIVEDLWALSSAELTFEGTGVVAAVKVVCNEVQPDLFLPTSTSLNASFKLMGMKAEASYLSAVHYTQVRAKKWAPDAVLVPTEQALDADKSALKLTRKQQKMRDKITELSAKEELSNADAYRLYKLASRSLSSPDTLKSKKKFERVTVKVENEIKRDSLAGKRDSLYWASVRSVPLRLDEKESYKQKQLAVVRRDSLGQQGDTLRKSRKSLGDGWLDPFLNGKTFQTKDQKFWFKTFDVLTYVPEYNWVDGWWVGAKWSGGVKFSPATTLSVTPSVYYTTARHKWVGHCRVTLNYAPLRSGRLVIKGGASATDFNGESGESRQYNSLFSLFGRSDVAFYEKRYLAVDHQIEIANGLQLYTSLEWAQRSALQNRVSRPPFGGTVDENAPSHPEYVPMAKNKTVKSVVELAYTPAHYYRLVKGRKVYEEARYPTISLRYERAYPIKQADYQTSYHRFDLQLHQSLEFGLFNHLTWSMEGGLFTKARQLTFADYKQISTTRLPLTQRPFTNSFFATDSYRYATRERWAEGHLTWQNPYLLLKRLPFLRKSLFDEAIHASALVTYRNTPYEELGYSVGFENTFRLGLFLGFERFKQTSVGFSVSLPLNR